MHIVCVRYAYTLIVRILDTDDMRTRAGSTHIVCVRYAYYLLWCAYWTWTICIQINVYAYRLCPICAPEQVVCISDMDNMHTHLLYAYWTQTICIQINVYAYRLCPICAPEQVVRMLDMDDMHTNNNIYRHIFMCGNWTISSDCTPN